MLAEKWAGVVQNDPGLRQSTACRSFSTAAQGPRKYIRQGSHGAESATILCDPWRRQTTSAACCHVWREEGGNEVAWVIGAYSRHAKAIDGTALAPGCTRKRNGGRRQRIGCGRSVFMSLGRRPPKSSVSKPLRECQTEKEIKVNDALELVLWTTDTE